MHHLIVVVVAVVALCFCHVTNAIVLPHHISSHMVLPRSPLLANIWGYETPGFTVTVQHDSVVRSAVADADGNWLVTLPPTGVLFDQTITISTSANASDVVTLTDVAFGDVYLCVGQSNMEFSTAYMFNGEEIIADSVNHPDIRLFPVRRHPSPFVFNDTKSRYGPEEPWRIVAPQYLNGSIWDYFSAVCYVYGLGLSRALGGKVPIGLIESANGGAKISVWSPPEALKLCDRDESALGAQADSALYWGQLAPLLNVQFASIVYYQGESNEENATLYRCQFPALIQTWRNDFRLPNLPFLFVLQAPPETAELRDAQLLGLNLGNVSTASAIDLGDPFSPTGYRYPRNKTILALRLADVTLHNLYGRTDIISEGPMQTSPCVFTNSSQNRLVSLQLTYSVGDNTPNNAGLQLSGTANCSTCCSMPGNLLQLELTDSRTGRNVSMIATSVKVVDEALTATADLSRYPNTIYVSAFAIEWEDEPQCIIANKQYLPQLPSLSLIETCAVKQESNVHTTMVA